MANDLTAEEYQHALAVLNDPNAKLTDEERTLLLGVRDQFDQAYSQGQGTPAQRGMAVEPIPGDLGLVRPAEPQPDPVAAPIAHALSLSPATTHPEGDDAAAEEWIRNPEQAAQGRVFVYEPPLQAAKKELLENPALISILYPDLGPEYVADPRAIAAITTDSDEYKRYADHKWRETADEAAKAGKVAYRYAKAPYLQGEAQGLDPLATLGLKMKGAAPLAQMDAERFVMGVDKAATLGAYGRSVVSNAQKNNPNLGVKLEGPDMSGVLDKLVGEGIAKDAEKEGPPKDTYVGLDNGPQSYDQFMAGGKGVAALGQGIGSLLPWSVANRAFAAASGAAAPIAGLGLNAMRNTAAAAVGGMGGAALEQTGLEAVGAGSQAANGEQTDLAGAPARIGEAAGVGLVTSPILHLLGGEAANHIRHESPRYGGNVGEFEAAGGKLDFGLGPRAPRQAQEAVLEARGRQAEPVDVQAQRLAPKVEESIEKNLAAQREAIEVKNAPFYASPEGQMRLPATNTVKKQVELLDANHSAEKGFLEPIPNKKDQVTYLRNQLNDTVSDVSVRPVQDAVELTPRQADAFLSESRKRALKEQLEGPKGPTTGAREIDLEGGGGGDDVSFEELLKRKGVDKVYLVPKRFTAKEHEQLIRGYQKLDDPADPNARERKELYEAGFEDRKARPLNGQPGAWSAQQKQNSLGLEAAEEEARLALRGGKAFKPLVDFSRRHRGQIELADAVRAAAGRAGSKEELEQLRVLGLLDNLNRLSSPLGGNVGGIQRAAFGPNAAFDSTTLRIGYPLLKLLEGPLGGLKGGLGGAVGPAVIDNQEREKP